MFSVSVTEKGGQSQTHDFDKGEISIGRIQGNDIVLPKSNISKKHARIINNEGGFVVVDAKSTNGTYINGKRIDAPYDLQAGDKIFVGDFTIEVQARGAAKRGAPPPPPAKDEASQPASARLSDDEWAKDGKLDKEWADDWGHEAKPGAAGRGKADSQADAEAEDESDDQADAEVEDEPSQPPAIAKLANDAFSRSSQREVLDRLDQEEDSPPPKKAQKRAAPPPAAPERPRAKVQAAPAAAAEAGGAGLAQASRVVHERLLRSLDLRRLNVERMDDAELRSRTRAAVEEIIGAMKKARELEGVDSEQLIEDVLHEALGLGPLEDLLADESVTEILVNGPTQIWVERDGRLSVTDRTFSSDQAVLGVIERIVAPIGRRVDESSPMVDARLKDGSRVNAIVPPLSLRGPCLTIRKFTREPMQIDDLVAKSTLSADIADFIETCVKARKNIVISGGTGSGKTTTLNVMSGFIPEGERIITIEDAAELKLDQSHVVSLESRPPNIEGKGAITIRDLVRNALRMRPDRIVVGECRGGETLDMLQAMNTGHDGSLTTVHANGPRDALSRLETMVLMSGMDLPLKAVRDQIASAVDIIVQQTRFPDGSRRVTHVSEVTGIEGEVIAMQDIFTFEQKGFDADGKVTGRFRPTGVIPRFYEGLKAMGIKANLKIFQKE
jgi:pilus assembly protein CpaF